MTVEIAVQDLQRVPFFNGLSPQDLAVVLDAAQVKTAPEGSFLFYQDDPVTHIYVLAEGRMKLSQLSADGQQVIMRMATPWMLVAAIGLVEGAVYPVTAEVAEDSRVLAWSQADMQALLARFPALTLNALKVLAGHVREFQDRYRELATERVERRVARAIIRLASQAGKKTPEGVLLDLPLTRQDLAEMCGTTLYTVSRILSQWESSGLVIAGREKVIIRFPHGLVAIADDLPRPRGGRLDGQD